MFNFSQGFDVNPIQMGPQFAVAWEEDAKDTIQNLCWDIADQEGTHLIYHTTLCDYLREANLPNYYDLPADLRNVIDEELEIY